MRKRYLARYPVLGLAAVVGAGINLAWAQSAPASADKPWHSQAEESLGRQLAGHPETPYAIDSDRAYTLAELVDLAQQHNPETRAAWEAAKVRAADLGIARSALFPTLTAVVIAESLREAALTGANWGRQTEGLFIPVLHVDYLVFDFGERGGAIDAAKASVLAANLKFNDTHRKLIFAVSSAYYRLLNARGLREAAEISLKNAQAVEDDAQARLDHGLATKPDVLEATAAQAQAEYDLQAAVGAEAIAAGDLATSMGLPADTAIKVQEIQDLATPKEMADSVDVEIDRAFAQRPELLEQVTRLRAADASLKQAHSAFLPSMSFTGDGGLARGYGQFDSYPGEYAQGEYWNVTLQLKWTLFDGTRREHELAAAHAEKHEAEAEIGALRDQISDEVWTAYTNMKTALRQQQAAAALLAASGQSYDAARESYGYGVRNLLDVVQAQKALAQARSEDVSARAQVLLQVANLAFRTGDLVSVTPAKGTP
ncbi:TolC family protein [Silvibacterium dinghuense]|uniref:TolC family protein n=1 Tax=Silvibacterium dinghuense TaxID=1560006 RepID=A0A4Q1SGY9_9BACT|nr:TolC family protein [Silvibacterium dinghuense]RXS96808.1 TolC family protein [Silvibacterium dinghuense]GGG93815.1 protein CyaE [Silvibacterium dinghuense]